MALIEWTENLQVGIEKVDEQHHKLVDLLNALDEAKQTGKGNRVMGQLLQDLIDYTVEHFAFEEKLMVQADYPEIQLHQAQHKQLVDKVLHFQHQFLHGGQRITKEVMQFLKYWLESHILKEDMAFGQFAANILQQEETQGVS